MTFLIEKFKLLFFLFFSLFCSFLSYAVFPQEVEAQVSPSLQMKTKTLSPKCTSAKNSSWGKQLPGAGGIYNDKGLMGEDCDEENSPGQKSETLPSNLTHTERPPLLPGGIKAVPPLRSKPVSKDHPGGAEEKNVEPKKEPEKGEIQAGQKPAAREKLSPINFEEKWFKKRESPVGLFKNGDAFFDEERKKEKKKLTRFGLDFFTPARRKIEEMERRIIAGELQLPRLEQHDALAGFVGPLEMVTSSVYADIPDRYFLSPNDQINISYWAKMLDFTKITLRVDQSGYVTIPKVGKMVARGMTLNQFQKNLKANLKRVTVKDLELIVTLDRLKSLQVFITGEAFRPGSYAVSAMTTLFNALYACGGPTRIGSLRDIKLLRNGKTIRIDFYEYLLKGDSHNDIPLQPGDVIFISPVTKVVSLSGEVRRPGRFELRKSENLPEAIELAQGIKATGITQRLQITSLVPNKERKLIDLEIGDKEKLPEHPLYDGDSVFVYPLISEVENKVTLEGKVERPGEYELKKDMKVSDLFSEMNQPLRDAYLERADIVRTNDDLVTTTLVPVNLKKALAKIPGHDLRLAPLDKVIVYSIRDVEFKPRAEVAVVGAVQRPKGYTRSEKMTVKDLLLQAGGVLPNAYLKRADLLRYDFTKEVTTIIPINVQKAMEGRKSSDLLLKDRDLLRIYTIKERAFTPPHRVLILGAVQRPKEYIRSERMTVKDLLLKAGGVLPNAYLKRADLLRYDFTKEITTIIPINLEDVLAGDQTANIEMKDRDILRLFTLQERRYTPPHKLRIFGAVQRPGEYERSFGMRIRDLLFAAGDVTPGNKNEIEIARASRGDEIEILNLDYQKIVGGDEEENILLQDQDVVMIKKKTEFFESPLFITISGEVKYAGTYALKSRKERASSLIKRAGGVTDLAYLKGTVFTRERKHLVTKEQQKDLASSNKVFDLINTFEYERQLARNRFLWQKEQEPDDPLPLSSMGSAPVVSAGADTSKAAAISMAPATAEGVGRTVEGVMDSIGDLPSVVSRARKLGENDLRTSDRIIVEMEKVLSNPGQGEDLILMPGDAISIPGRPATVSVVGAVMRPTSISFKKNRRPEEYINLSGGFSGDADKEQLLVLSVDGSISPARERKQIEYGDIIYVPPKVMSLDIVERIDKIIEVTKFALATTASVVVFVVLIGLF